MTHQQPATGTYAQFGAGHCGPAEWLNFDASPTLWLERLPVVGRFVQKNSQRFPSTVRYGDIVAGLPLPAASCLGLYGSHILEHLTYQELRQALRNCHALLKDGGVVRIVVPDLEWSIRRYAERPGDAAAASNFMRETCLGVEDKPRGITRRLSNLLGKSQHFWMWDEKGLSREFEEAGFKNVRRCQLGDARDPMFRLVEEAGRFENALAIEASK